MRNLTEKEYRIAHAILIKYLDEGFLFDKIQTVSGINLYESNITRSTENLFDALMTFLEIPEDETLKDENGYCRDWVGNLETDVISPMNCSVSEKAKKYLDLLIQNNK